MDRAWPVRGSSPLQVTSRRGGTRASSEDGVSVLLQGRRLRLREAEPRAGVCLQMSLMRLSSSGLSSASGLKINFHRRVSSWAFSVPAKTSAKAAAGP